MRTITVMSITFLFYYKYACVNVSWRVFFDEIDTLISRVKQTALHTACGPHEIS